MTKYAIKQVILEKPEVELPEGSHVVIIKHHDAYHIPGGGAGDMDFPQCWQVIWLEPAICTDGITS